MVLSVDPIGAGARRLDHDDELAPRVARMDFAAVERRDRGLDLGEPLGPRLHQHARDLGAGRSDEPVGIGEPARDEGAAVDGRSLSGMVAPGSWRRRTGGSRDDL